MHVIARTSRRDMVAVKEIACNGIHAVFVRFVGFAKGKAIFLSGGFHDLRAGTSAGHFKASVSSGPM
jgi:hypothetical protein